MQKGFTLIELIIVIVILGILAVVAAPRFLDISKDAKIASLNGIKGQLESTIQMVQAKARIAGLKPLATNPNSLQSELIVEFGFGRSEVMFSNLCPESDAELGDALDAFDFLEISQGSSLVKSVYNRHSFIGFKIPDTENPTASGCYLVYDSFATPDCTITLVVDEC